MVVGFAGLGDGVGFDLSRARRWAFVGLAARLRGDRAGLSGFDGVRGDSLADERTVGEELPDARIERLADLGTPEGCASAVGRLAGAAVLVALSERNEELIRGVSKNLTPTFGSWGG